MTKKMKLGTYGSAHEGEDKLLADLQVASFACICI